MAELTKEEFARAKSRGETRMLGPRAESAHYDAGRNRIIVRLTTGVELGFAPGNVVVQRLATRHSQWRRLVIGQQLIPALVGAACGVL